MSNLAIAVGGKSFFVPDVFLDWRNNAIDAGDTRIAPEFFYLLDEDGRREYFFTWYEARMLENSILAPHGWRLTIEKECVSCLLPDISRVQLPRYGYIDAGEVAEHRARLDFGNCRRYAQAICFWTGTEGKSFPQNHFYGAGMLEMDEREAHVYCRNKYDACPVLCVSV